MSVIRRGSPWCAGAVASRLLWPLSLVLALAACSSATNRGVTGSVGVSTGVVLSTPGSVTQIQVGTTIVVSASVTADVNNAGVTWICTCSSSPGTGTLSDITATTVTFNAPASVNGAVDAIITATSVVNSAAAASVTLVSLGSPVMNTVQLFPANVNVPYAATITVSGGEEDFTWATAPGSGPLPPGIILNGSTTAVTSISGTPTATGSYSFTLQATDALSRVATQTISMVVNAEDTCLLIGRFSFIVTGFRGGGPATHAGSISIDEFGNITGEQDYKDGHRTTAHEALTSGTCINRQTNSGQVTLNAPSGTTLYNFSVTPPDSTGSINSARLQLIGSGSDSASGQLARQDASAIPTAPPAGNFAFGLLTVANQEPYTVHTGSAGRFSSDGSGTISAGLVDSNASPALTAAPLSGTLSAPDSLGRGTANFTAGAHTSNLVYYIVNAAKMYLMDIGAFVNPPTPRSTGFLTPQAGNLADGTFDNGALAVSPSILSLWGAVGNGVDPITEMSLGRLYNGNAAAGSLDAVLDISDRDVDSAGLAYTTQPYTVASSGRGTLTLTTVGLSRSFVFYLDGTSSGYVIEPGSDAGNAGMLEAQYTPGTGIYTDTLQGFFVGGTQYAQVPGPIVLTPSLLLSFGVLSSNFTNGQFAFDPTSGRGFGSITATGVPTSAAVLYQVTPLKMDLMNFGTITTDGTISWLIQN